MMQAVPLELLESCQDLVKRAYRMGYEDCERTWRNREVATCSAVDDDSHQVLAMAPREKLPSEKYREYFMKGSWPTNVGDDVKAVPYANLVFGPRAKQAVLRAIEPYGEEFAQVTIGHILAVSPGEMLEDFMVRRGLGEKGISQLLDSLSTYGIRLQYPVV